MSNKRGQLNCTTNTKNVGYGTCFLDWKIIKGALLYDNPRTFSDAEIAALQTTLQDDAANDIKGNRLFPMHNFVAPTDNTEAVVVESFDYGSRQITRDGFNDWSFQYVDGGACLQGALRTHNGKKYVLFYDKEFKIMGWGKSTGYSTIPLEFFYAEPFKLATGANVAKYLVRFVFDPKYSNEEVDFVKADFDVSEVTGLSDINIIQNSWNQNTGVANVTLQTACGSDNIFDLYPTQIVAGLFQAFDDQGNVVPVASVARVTGTKTYNFTLSHTAMPDNGIVTLSGKAISVLDAGGVVGYEIGSTDLAVHGSF